MTDSVLFYCILRTLEAALIVLARLIKGYFDYRAFNKRIDKQTLNNDVTFTGETEG